jgi:hypothetical protein
MLPCEPARASNTAASLLMTYCADLPMSAVNCCLIFVEGSTDKTVRAPPATKLGAPFGRLADVGCAHASFRFARWSRRFWSRCCCLASS